MTSYECWSLVASFGALLVSVVAFGAVLWQLVMLSRATTLDHDRRRKQATVEYLAATMDRRKELRDEGIPDERDPAAVSALIGRMDAGDRTATRLVYSYLTIYNHLGVGARSDAFDLRVIDQAWGGSVIAIWEGYRPWIERQRRARCEPRLYEDLEHLAALMTPRRVTAPPEGRSVPLQR
ncbi:DUF4760 domain-containing protein [Streptomyces sp. NPDC049597]|uniref:DUF4760 domain-containing protein n=1 Tax=Streptomyces sp. NPDC049597 TaxID=3155276 RepID=UPI003417D5A5